MTKKRLCSFLFATFVGASASCSEHTPQPVRHPVYGSLTYNGKPATGAFVIFHPLPLERNDWRTVRPQALVESDGTFQPNSAGVKDGAAAGEYVLAVVWYSGPGGPDQFAGRFADPKKPVLKVTIHEGENTIPPIQLTGPSLKPVASGRAHE